MKSVTKTPPCFHDDDFVVVDVGPRPSDELTLRLLRIQALHPNLVTFRRDELEQMGVDSKLELIRSVFSELGIEYPED